MNQRDALIRDLENCVRCGSCKAKCPTYDLGLSEGVSARGRVVLAHALLTGEMEPSDKMVERLYGCLLCGMCEPSCPVGVKITDGIFSALEMLVRQDRQRRLYRHAAKHILSRPHMAFRLARRFPSILNFMRSQGLMPFDIRLPEAPLRAGLEVYTPHGEKAGRVALFVGCAVNYLYPHLGSRLIDLLTDIGYEVVLPAGEVCCGEPLRALGMAAQAEQLALRNIEVFNHINAEAVLSLCPTCTLTIGRHYGQMIGYQIKGAMDATVFLADKLKGRALVQVGGEAVYHDPCHLAFGLGAKKQPRDLLRQAGMGVKEPEQYTCCGFSQSFGFSGVSEALLVRQRASLSSAPAVVTACPGCMMQLERANNRVSHVIEHIALHDG